MENLWDVRGAPSILPSNLVLDNVDVQTGELVAFKAAGGACVIDSASVSEGRNPEGLVRAALRSGCDVIMSASVEVGQAESTDVNAMAATLVKELQIGVEVPAIHDGSNKLLRAEGRVCAGVIGGIRLRY